MDSLYNGALHIAGRIFMIRSKFIHFYGCALGLSILVILFLVHLYLGFIPVGGGAGWDGSVYLDHIQKLADGLPVEGDPYRAIRTSGFLHLIPLAHIGMSRDGLIFLQALLNSALLSISAALLYDAIIALGVGKEKAITAIAMLLLSWVFFVIPMYNPVLSDNLALPLCSVCIWCWVKSFKVPLYLMCGYFTWLFPGLFLVPLILASFPFVRRDESYVQMLPAKYWIASFVVISCAAIYLFLSLVSGLSKADIIAHGARGDGETGILDLLFVSGFVQALSLVLLSWIAVRIVFDLRTWQSVSVKGFAVSMSVVVISFCCMFNFIDFGSGFQGPPFLSNLLMQSMAAPFKPWAAHFLCLGVVVVLAAYSCLRWSFDLRWFAHKTLVILFSCFLPFLIFGSESRQWIGVLPVAVVMYALMDTSRSQRVLGLVTSIASLAPLPWLNKSVVTALDFGLKAQSAEWQFYFGRQGPWMSVGVYEIGILGLVAFLLAYTWLGRRARPKTINVGYS
ncbi:hypothetical protein OH720_10950 [Pseudomonas sp. WJP1]|uniref:hypothetical protein n=1 Tax=Pseudomonas sp. WJP1 TaxID=2986947 RepID=UPI0023492D43|nr:hypothetical protein [Pseudomonas sp. WJP1]WCM53498.1 hypothetical protein OH720_10950 [Pseudomonas sp. WJP1]